MGQEAWKQVVADLAVLREELTNKVVRNLPITPEADREQCFYRGQIAGIERIIELEQEIKEWRAERK